MLYALVPQSCDLLIPDPDKVINVPIAAQDTTMMHGLHGGQTQQRRKIIDLSFTCRSVDIT